MFMVRVLGLVIGTARSHHKEIVSAFDVGRACGRVSIKAEMGMLPCDDVDRLVCDFGPTKRRHLRLVP